jgi:hypothetical protein
VTTSSTLADVLRLMREQHTHRVFVVTSKTEMLPLDVGVITCYYMYYMFSLLFIVTYLTLHSLFIPSFVPYLTRSSR